MDTLTVGQTIQTFPGSLLWQQGARFGEVVAIHRKPAKVLVRFRRGAMWLPVSTVLEG